MKTFFRSILIALTLFAAFSCSDDEDKKTITKMEDLVIQPGFNFETTQKVNIKITAPDGEGTPIKGAKIDVYVNDPETDGKLLISGLTNEQGIYETNTTVPTYVSELYLKTNSNSILTKSVKVPIANGKIDYTYTYLTEAPPRTGAPSQNASEIFANSVSPNSQNEIFRTKPNGKNGNEVNVIVFQDNMENGINGWTTQVVAPGSNISPNLWHQISISRNSASTKVWWSGIGNSPGNYNNGKRVSNALISPTIALPNQNGLVLTFDESYNTELCWDFCMVSVSTNNGSTWTELRGGYGFPGSAGPFPYSPSGNSGGWITSTASLDAFKGQNVKIRFYFETIDGIIQNFPGWMVDNVIVNAPDPDSDGDGIFDTIDEYPNDPTKAFNKYYPDKGGKASLAFEDQWPNLGDYDFNDLVIDYSWQGVTNGNNQLVEAKGKFTIKAIGANYKNGFGVEWNLDPARVASVTGSQLSSPSYITLAPNGVEANQSKTVFIVFDNASALMPRPGGANFVNTVESESYVQPVTVEILITFVTPLTQNELVNIEPPFNPFMIVQKVRGHEVHLPDQPPTSLADLTLFGTASDDSDPSQNRYYKTVTNLPWAIGLPTTFNYPIEKELILNAYNHFADWAQSSGNSYKDWYLPNSSVPGNVNEAVIYVPPTTSGN
ncbi:LruC domain-containing protein [bacterium]|nr:LruC domain-containing protein [bacterium]